MKFGTGTKLSIFHAIPILMEFKTFSARLYPKMTKKLLKKIENPKLRRDVSTMTLATKKRIGTFVTPVKSSPKAKNIRNTLEETATYTCIEVKQTS